MIAKPTCVVVLAAIAAAALACTRQTEPASDASMLPPAAAPPTDQAAAVDGSGVAPSSLGAGLDEALARGVVAPSEGGSTYRIDPFVAALVVTAAERESERWFSAYSGQPPKVEHSVSGWRVTGVGERAGLLRLGLREGDIVVQVNGVPASDAGSVRRALPGSDKNVTVGVFREDYELVIDYRFEPGLAWSRTLEGFGGEPGEDDGGGAVAVAVDDTRSAGAASTSTPTPTSTSTPTSTTTPTSSSSSSSSSGAKSGAGKPSGTGTTTPTKPSAGSPVSCASEDDCTIRKSFFDSMVSSPSKIESQATIVPAIRNDVFSGYKLSFVRPGSAIADLGFKSGDKITHINGRDLTDDAEAFALYLSLSSTSAYKIRYLRGSSTRTKTVLVR